MKIKTPTTIALIAGCLLTAAGLLWWYMFYGPAVAQMEYATYEDVARCLYSYSDSCRVVNNSVALLADTVPYNPALFLVGVLVGAASVVCKLLVGRRVPKAELKV